MRWPQTQLVAIVDPAKGSLVSGPFGSNIGSKFFVEAGVPVIRGNNLTKGTHKFIDDGFVFLTEQKAQEFPNCVAIEDDLIFTAAGSIGQVGIIPKERKFDSYIISNKQIRARIDRQKALPEFVYFWLSSRKMVQYLESQNNGGAVPLLNLGLIRRLPVPLPSLNAQDKIVDILSAYDDLIGNNRRRIKLLEQAARQLYREWFVRLRFPGHEHTKIVDSVPEGWERTTVGSLASYIKRGITPSYDDEGDSIVINQKCIRNSLLSLEPARRQRKEIPHQKRIQLGDVLINSTGAGTLGRVAQVWTDLENHTVDTHVTIVRPGDKVGNYWLGFSLLRLEPLIETLGEGATNQTELSWQKISALEILQPSSDLRNEFDDFASTIAKQISGLQAQSQKLAQARDFLLPRLMDGRIAA